MIIIILLFLPLFNCNSPMNDILKNHKDDIIFLIRDDCPKPPPSPTGPPPHPPLPPPKFIPNILESNNDLAMTPMRDREVCSDTIGFMPTGENKVRVFITANSKIENIDVTKISLKYKKGANDFHLADCDKTGSVTLLSNPKTELEEELKKDNEFRLKKIENIIQCDTFEITVGDELVKLYGQDAITWIMELRTGPSSEVLQVTVEGSGLTVKHIIGVGIRCDPGKLKTTGIPANDEYDIKEVEKTEGSADKVKNSDNKPFTLTKISADCTKGYTKLYKVDDQEQLVKSVECKKQVDEKFWKYEVEVPDGGTLIKIDRAKEIEVKCVRKNCKDCDLLDKKAEILCENDAGCSVVINSDDTEHIPYDQCRFLKTDACTNGLVYMNSKFVKFSPAEKIMCNKEKKFMLNGEEIRDISCAQQYSATATDPTKNYVEPTFKSIFKMDEPRNCGNLTIGCQCINANKNNYLAVAAKSDWIRVKSVIFDPKENVWNYERIVEIGADGKEKMEQRKLENGRPLRCIPAVAKLGKLPNPKDTVVIAVNIALICVALLVSIPGVIFFVSTKEKQREAYKAAKANKKKEDKSEDKKDGEKKNDDKKNEA